MLQTRSGFVNGLAGTSFDECDEGAAQMCANYGMQRTGGRSFAPTATILAREWSAGRPGGARVAQRASSAPHMQAYEASAASPRALFQGTQVGSNRSRTAARSPIVAGSPAALSSLFSGM